MSETNVNQSIMAAKLSRYKDTDLTLTPEEEAIWNSLKEERESTMAHNKKKFKVLLIIYIIMFIGFLILSSYVIYRMIEWDYVRKLIVLNSKTLGTKL